MFSLRNTLLGLTLGLATLMGWLRDPGPPVAGVTSQGPAIDKSLVHLVFAVWKTNRPFDPGHYPWEPADAQGTTTAADAPVTTTQGGAPATTTAAGEPGGGTAQENAVGHKRVEPAGNVVTTAPSTIEPAASAVKPATPSIELVAVSASAFRLSSRDPAADGIPPETARVCRTLYRKDHFSTIFRPGCPRCGDFLRSKR